MTRDSQSEHNARRHRTRRTAAPTRPSATIFLRRAVAVGVALIASVAIAACGGSKPAASNTASTADTGLKLAACARAHGVPDYPDPRSSGGGVTVQARAGKLTVGGRVLSESLAELNAALTKCQKYSSYNDSSFGPRYSAAQMARVRTDALAMSQCMRGHGVPSYPDLEVGPGPGGHGFSLGFPRSAEGKVDYKSPAYRAANRACSRLLQSAIQGGKG